jgi:hypothetical protein
MHGWGRPPDPTAGTMPGAVPAYPDQARSWPPPSHPAWAHLPAARAGAGVPYAVRLACLLTWVFSLVTGGLYLLLLLAIAVDRGEVVDLLHDNPDVRDVGLTDRELIGLLVAMSGVVLLWCLAASLLAVLTWRRHAWARVLLLVSVGAAAVFEMLALPFSVLHLAACVIAFVLLLQPASRAWAGSTGRTAPPSWPAGPPGPPAPPPGWPPTPPPGWPQESGQHQAPPVTPPPAASPPPDPPPPDRPSGKPPVW